MATREERNAYVRAWRASRHAACLAYQKAWREAHRKECCAYTQKWRTANPEKVRAYKKRWLKTHAHKNRVHSQTWRNRNLEEHRAASRAYNLAHPEEVKAGQRRRYAADPDRYQEVNKRRKAWKRGAPVSDLTLEQWKEIKAAYDNRCVYCGRKMQRLTQDHITPLSRGGSHTYTNIVPACASCNSRKSAGGVLRPVQPLLLTVAGAATKKDNTK